MGLFNGILDNIQFKGGKTNVIIKWLIGLVVGGTIIAFGVGQYKERHMQKLNNIESLALEGIEKTELLEKRVEEGLDEQNTKIDRIYNDGVKAFNEYREFNNSQLDLIIDYGHENKELLKKMLELNSKEKAAEISSKLEMSKREALFGINDTVNAIMPSYFSNIDSFRIKRVSSVEPDIMIFTKIEPYNSVGMGRKTFYVINAPKDYLDNLDLDKYVIISEKESDIYRGLYNYIYREK